MDTIQDILKKLIARNPKLSERLEEARTLEGWDKAVGPQIARHARAIRVEKGVLWIEVDHSIWRTELHHRKKQILDKLNAAGGKTVIQDLFLVDVRRSRF